MRRKMWILVFACLSMIILLAAPASKNERLKVIPASAISTSNSGKLKVAPVSTVPTTITIGNATLHWDAPTTYEDGSPLTVAGYYVYYRTKHGKYILAIDLKLGSPTAYDSSLLSGVSATYYFAVKAYDSSGRESVYSNEASKYIKVN